MLLKLAGCALPGTRRRRVVLAGTVALACLSAQVVHAAGHVQTAATSEQYLLAPGDKVIITVFGQADLSGEQMVDASGHIVLPLAGNIEAGNVTVAELERRVTQRLADGYLNHPRVSVRLAELRPIYVLGQVKQAGNYPFRYGMTALGAVAVAGGPAVNPQEKAVLRAELLAAQQQVNVLKAGQFALRARAARLEALRDGKEELEFPPSLAGDNGDPAIARVLQGQREVFAIQRKAEAKEIDALEQQEPQIRLEIRALAEQSRLEQTQLELISQHLTGLLSLVKKGLTERQRVLSVQREQANIKETQAKLGVDAARAAERLADIRTRIQELRNRHQRDFMVELQDVDARLLEGRANLNAANQMLALRRRQLGGAVETADGSLGPITIIRTLTSGTRTIVADESTRLRPGDIVRVGNVGGSGVAVSGSPHASEAPHMVLGSKVSISATKEP